MFRERKQLDFKIIVSCVECGFLWFEEELNVKDRCNYCNNTILERFSRNKFKPGSYWRNKINAFYLKEYKKLLPFSKIRELMRDQGGDIVSREAVYGLIDYIEGLTKKITVIALEIGRKSGKKKISLKDIADLLAKESAIL